MLKLFFYIKYDISYVGDIEKRKRIKRVRRKKS